MQVEVLNLDAMNVEELTAVGDDCQQPMVYRLYAKRKAMAMQARLAGDIQRALIYEGDCDNLYDGMHRDFRW